MFKSAVINSCTTVEGRLSIEDRAGLIVVDLLVDADSSTGESSEVLAVFIQLLSIGILSPKSLSSLTVALLFIASNGVVFVQVLVNLCSHGEMAKRGSGAFRALVATVLWRRLEGEGSAPLIEAKWKEVASTEESVEEHVFIAPVPVVPELLVEGLA